MSKARDDTVDINSEIQIKTISQTRGSRPLTALRNMTALYQSRPSRSCDSEETVRSVVSQESSFGSTTPHSINDILARSTRPIRPSSPQASAGTLLSASQMNVAATKSPIVRLASPGGLAMPAAAGTASPSMYCWTAAATASLMSPSICWNQRGTSS